MKRELAILAILAAPALAAERDAARIGQAIEKRHLPHGTILDPVFASPSSNRISGYTRCGDSALWTGVYLAAEAFRFQATGSRSALANAERAMAGLRDLVDVTGDDSLARCWAPVGWRYAAGMLREEQSHGVHTATLRGRKVSWVGDASRDQYCGVFFGLSVAYERIEAPGFRARVRLLVERTLESLRVRGWSEFRARPDHRLALLQVGRQVNPSRFQQAYADFWRENAERIPGLISLETLDPHGSYFKFNLDYLNWYSLVRLEDDPVRRELYLRTFQTLRVATGSHGNPHFNLIGYALQGPDPAREAETRALLDAWIERPPRDSAVDLRGGRATCGADRSCDPLPVPLRVRTDFLWQRSPFLLFGGGSGTIESAGLDYLLPYWMGRAYGVLR